MANHDSERETRRGTAVKDRHKTRRPKLYKVLLHNDDYTTMEFVVHVLIQFFDKTRTDATRIMLLIHHQGLGVAGVYTRDVAETKVGLVTDHSRESGHPLKVTMEAE